MLAGMSILEGIRIHEVDTLGYTWAFCSYACLCIIMLNSHVITPSIAIISAPCYDSAMSGDEDQRLFAQQWAI